MNKKDYIQLLKEVCRDFLLPTLVECILVEYAWCPNQERHVCAFDVGHWCYDDVCIAKDELIVLNKVGVHAYSLDGRYKGRLPIPEKYYMPSALYHCTTKIIFHTDDNTILVFDHAHHLEFLVNLSFRPISCEWHDGKLYVLKQDQLCFIHATETKPCETKTSGNKRETSAEDFRLELALKFDFQPTNIVFSGDELYVTQLGGIWIYKGPEFSDRRQVCLGIKHSINTPFGALNAPFTEDELVTPLHGCAQFVQPFVSVSSCLYVTLANYIYQVYDKEGNFLRQIDMDDNICILSFVYKERLVVIGQEGEIFTFDLLYDPERSSS